MNREELIDAITKAIEKLNTLPNIKEENFNMGYKKAIYDSCYLYENMNQEIERLNKENEYLNNKHEKIIHNIMEFIDKNTFNHRNTGERILTLHGKGILDLLDICLGSDKE